MYSTRVRVHVYTCTSLTDILARILERKIAHVGKVGEDSRACLADGEAEHGSHQTADILATILVRKSAMMSVSASVLVSVSAPRNASYNDAANASCRWPAAAQFTEHGQHARRHRLL